MRSIEALNWRANGIAYWSALREYPEKSIGTRIRFRSMRAGFLSCARLFVAVVFFLGVFFAIGSPFHFGLHLIHLAFQPGQLLVGFSQSLSHNLRELQHDFYAQGRFPLNQIEKVGPEESYQQTVRFAHGKRRAGGFVKQTKFTEEIALRENGELLLISILVHNGDGNRPFLDDVHTQSRVTLMKHGFTGPVLALMNDRGDFLEFAKRQIGKCRDFAQQFLDRTFPDTSFGKNVLPNCVITDDFWYGHRS